MTDRDIDVLVAGRVFADLVFTGVHAPAPGAEVYADGFAISPGGAANRAVASARLGARTALVAELGDDPIGCIVARSLRDEPDLDLRFAVQRTDYQIPISVAITDGHERSFVTYEHSGELPPWPASDPGASRPRRPRPRSRTPVRQHGCAPTEPRSSAVSDGIPRGSGRRPSSSISKASTSSSSTITKRCSTPERARWTPHSTSWPGWSTRPS